jgi:HEAT repeat protein
VFVCLRCRRDAAAREALQARLARETETKLRAEIVEALGAVGDIDAVINNARDGEPSLLFRAAYVLGVYGDARAIPVLEHMTTSTERPPAASWSIGEQAKRALARLSRPVVAHADHGQDPGRGAG